MRCDCDARLRPLPAVAPRQALCPLPSPDRRQALALSWLGGVGGAWVRVRMSGVGIGAGKLGLDGGRMTDPPPPYTRQRQPRTPPSPDHPSTSDEGAAACIPRPRAVKGQSRKRAGRPTDRQSTVVGIHHRGRSRGGAAGAPIRVQLRPPAAEKSLVDWLARLLAACGSQEVLSPVPRLLPPEQRQAPRRDLLSGA